jgi:MHS family proline/betaine transporter-like MFS transporter
MKNLARISVFISTAIEVFDLSIFAFLIPVLSNVFFSSNSAQTALNFTILAYVISYVVKPFSGFIWGHISDKHGRKAVLSITTFLMTVSTAVIGLVPTNLPNIELWVLLFSCRIIQGISISGEFSNGVILAVELGDEQPGYSGSLAFMGGIFGLILANVFGFVLLKLLPYQEVIAYGWRIPFIMSAVIWCGLYQIRRYMKEPYREQKAQSNDLIHLLKHYKIELWVCFISASLSASAFYITFVYMPTMLSTVIQSQSHHNALWLTLIALIIYFISLPLFGRLADKIGIIKQLSIGSVLYFLFAYGCIEYISKVNVNLIFSALIFSALIQSLYNSALPAFMVSLFPEQVRGRALAIAYNSSLTIFGGLMPYVILTRGLFINPGVIISVFALMTFVFLRLMRK